MTRSLAVAVGTLLALFAQAAQKTRPESTGSYETQSLLGRKLFALADDGSIHLAQEALSADPKNPTLALKLSKAQAGRRQYS